MADESNLGTVRVGAALRWAAFAALVLAALVLYFAFGRGVPPFAAGPEHGAAQSP